MKHLWTFAMLLAFFSCRDSDPILIDPLDASRIEGHCWRDLTGTIGPEWEYCFERGLMTQTYHGFGVPITSLTFPYAIRRDTVFIGGDPHNQSRTWTLVFECDEVVAVLQNEGALNRRFWLQRL